MIPRLLLRVAASTLLVVLASAAAGSLAQKKTTKTITGKVLAYQVSREKVQSVYIRDPDQGEFLIQRSTDKGKELLRHVGATVKATGYDKESTREPEFKFVLDVLEYEVLEPKKDSATD